MQLTEEYKESIQWQIIDAIPPALEQGLLKEDEVSRISEYVTSSMKAVATHQQLVEFLVALANRWPVFVQIGNTEMGKAIEGQKEGVVDDVLAKAKSGDIEGALQLAKVYTTN